VGLRTGLDTDATGSILLSLPEIVNKEIITCVLEQFSASFLQFNPEGVLSNL
jgi:hypothetical protein